MLIFHIDIRVKPEAVEAFLEASRENARHSVNEPGIARFDVLQQVDDPTHVVFIEAYRTAEARKAHQETAHYFKWRDTVVDMMSQPRSRMEFRNVFPGDEGW
jgi:(4S)-4-hydroxy-5-phosphonooxypentane-2,3-dione isomerase